MGSHRALDEAVGFADRLTSLIQGVVPGTRELEVRELGNRVVIGLFSQDDKHEAFPLSIGGNEVASWMLSMRFDLDSHGRFLKVMKSNIVLTASVDRTPLVRYEFDDAMHTAPVAHWQFHGERGTFSHLLGQAQALGRDVRPHSLSSLHFPVGGSRMRPGIDDWVEFLVRECAFDAADDWLEHVLTNRRHYRLIQARTIARDTQLEAAAVLEEAGWTVTPPSAISAANPKFLDRW